MNRAAFFAAVRSAPFNGLTQPQVDGLNVILQKWSDWNLTDIRWLAYMLATTFHETAHTMQPIHERGTISYFNKYEPGTDIGRRLGNTLKGDGYRFRGRGYVQLTGRRNYNVAGNALNVDLVAEPDLALQPDNAAAIMFTGMKEGWFTGVRLADYINGAKCDYVNARRIINGTDRASMIAGYAVSFEKALKADGAVVVALKPGLVVGDSIAVGTGAELGGFETNAKVGIPSSDVIMRVVPGYRYYVISAGSNDWNNPLLVDNIGAMRQRADGTVIWIVPRNATAADAVRKVASRNGDSMVTFVPGADGVHPKSYQALARDVMSVIHTIEAQPQVSDQPVIPDGPPPVMPRPPDDPGPTPPETDEEPQSDAAFYIGAGIMGALFLAAAAKMLGAF